MGSVVRRRCRNRSCFRMLHIRNEGQRPSRRLALTPITAATGVAGLGEGSNSTEGDERPHRLTRVAGRRRASERSHPGDHGDAAPGSFATSCSLVLGQRRGDHGHLVPLNLVVVARISTTVSWVGPTCSTGGPAGDASRRSPGAWRTRRVSARPIREILSSRIASAPVCRRCVPRTSWSNTASPIR